MPKPENILGQGFHTDPDRINKKGRPKLPDIKDALIKVLADEKDGMNALEAVLKALRAKAVKGDVRAAEVLLDRAFGKAQSHVDHTSGGEKITININTDLI
jgi:hypothetical protein